MAVLIIRHGKSVDREDFQQTGKKDHLRPLTEKGSREFNLAARALRKLVGHIDTLYTSEFTRALQTAEILAGTYPDVELKPTSSLNAGERAQNVRQLIEAQNPGKTVAFVGHNPDLEELVKSLAGKTARKLKLKKGAVACLERRDGEYVLSWTKTQKELIKSLAEN